MVPFTFHCTTPPYNLMHLCEKVLHWSSALKTRPASAGNARGTLHEDCICPSSLILHIFVDELTDPKEVPTYSPTKKNLYENKYVLIYLYIHICVCTVCYQCVIVLGCPSMQAHVLPASMMTTRHSIFQQILAENEITQTRCQGLGPRSAWLRTPSHVNAKRAENGIGEKCRCEVCLVLIKYCEVRMTKQTQN